MGINVKKLNLDKKKLIKDPIKIIKKIKIHKLKNLTSFSLNKTFDNFKQKIKQAKKERAEIIKKEKIKEAKKEKLGQKRQKALEKKEIKKIQLLKLKEEKKILKMEEKFNVLNMIDNSILQDTNRVVHTKPIKTIETYEIPIKQGLNKTINLLDEIDRKIKNKGKTINSKTKDVFVFKKD